MSLPKKKERLATTSNRKIGFAQKNCPSLLKPIMILQAVYDSARTYPMFLSRSKTKENFKAKYVLCR